MAVTIHPRLRPSRAINSVSMASTSKYVEQNPYGINIHKPASYVENPLASIPKRKEAPVVQESSPKRVEVVPVVDEVATVFEVKPAERAPTATKQQAAVLMETEAEDIMPPQYVPITSIEAEQIELTFNQAIEEPKEETSAMDTGATSGDHSDEDSLPEINFDDDED
jgi:hypothetical protein